MNKRELDLLEMAFAAEIDHAVSKRGLGMLITKSKLAESLADRGYLKREEITIGGRFPAVVKGYGQTILGNLTYCMSDRCTDIDNKELMP